MPHARRDIEQTLHNSEERLRLIVDSSLDAVVTIDEQGQITGWNPQAEVIFGWPREEAMHRLLAELIIPHEYREAHRKGLHHYLSTGEGPVLNRRLELSALRKSGETFPIELTISPLRLGDHFEFSAFVRDITEPKRLETELRQANEELEQRVRERTAQLAEQAQQLGRANEALERSNLELKQFAYIASHDLQSPLRNISGFVQLLRSEYEGRLGERADDWIRRTVQSIQSMQTLIHDLLAYSRVDSQFRPLRTVAMRDVYNDAISMLETSIRDAGAELTCDELPTVVGDRAQLVQVLQNLIGNALTYHGDRPPSVQVFARHGGDEWVFCVRDNGIGIEPKYHERIFEVFQRLHDQRRYPGTGIGLAVCRRVVQRHGGKIWVESEPGSGSTFCFSIPQRNAS
jgi:PAS domain S-box-containing protein